MHTIPEVSWGESCSIIPLESDSYGRILHAALGDSTLVDTQGVVCAVVEIVDMLNFQEQLDQLKEENGWEPIVSKVPAKETLSVGISAAMPPRV